MVSCYNFIFILLKTPIQVLYLEVRTIGPLALSELVPVTHFTQHCALSAMVPVMITSSVPAHPDPDFIEYGM